MRFEFHRGYGCWSLRRYADVQAALRDPKRFAISQVAGFDEGGHTRALRHAMDSADFGDWRHDLEALPVARATEIVSGFAEPWSHAAAMRLLGIGRSPGNASGNLRELARAAYAAGASPMDPSLREPADSASRELAAVLPGSLGPLTVQAFVATSQTLAAFLSNSALALLEWKQVFAPRGLEELLRFAGPAQAQFRYAAEDFDGIARGSRIALLLAEANRDAEQFDDPNRLDFDRNAAGHLAFGGGPHACLGASLIRTAAPIALRRFSEAYAGAELESVVWPADVRAILSPLRLRIRQLVSGDR